MKHIIKQKSNNLFSVIVENVFVDDSAMPTLNIKIYERIVNGDKIIADFSADFLLSDDDISECVDVLINNHQLCEFYRARYNEKITVENTRIKDYRMSFMDREIFSSLLTHNIDENTLPIMRALVENSVPEHIAFLCTQYIDEVDEVDQILSKLIDETDVPIVMDNKDGFSTFESFFILSKISSIETAVNLFQNVDFYNLNKQKNFLMIMLNNAYVMNRCIAHISQVGIKLFEQFLKNDKMKFTYSYVAYMYVLEDFDDDDVLKIQNFVNSDQETFIDGMSLGSISYVIDNELNNNSIRFIDAMLNTKYGVDMMKNAYNLLVEYYGDVKNIPHSSYIFALTKFLNEVESDSFDVETALSIIGLPIHKIDFC